MTEFVGFNFTTGKGASPFLKINGLSPKVFFVGLLSKAI